MPIKASTGTPSLSTADAASSRHKETLMQYRKRIGSDTWHWCSNCSNWPTGRAELDYVVRYSKPTSGELDNECRSKEATGHCTKQQ